MKWSSSECFNLNSSLRQTNDRKGFIPVRISDLQWFLWITEWAIYCNRITNKITLNHNNRYISVQKIKLINNKNTIENLPDAPFHSCWNLFGYVEYRKAFN